VAFFPLMVWVGGVTERRKLTIRSEAAGDVLGSKYGSPAYVAVMVRSPAAANVI
jgi:hypothetical protein